MADDRKRDAETIFHAILEEPREKREAALAALCGSDVELRSLVERLLAHHEGGMGSFLEPMPVPTVDAAPSRVAPDRIGPYILRDCIGAGGMGEVWKAEQTSPVRRTVALKLIKAGMDSGQVLARFEAERQALALMDHIYIAKVYDAGVTERGNPYFVMEHIPGVPITDYCDQRRLDMKRRLELFERVCEGVQHAHQKAVIHRDIKPSNILVADVDGKPLPKIIDFGVAKATTQKLTEKTMHTALGQIIGTPEYMSPEQADLTSEDVDTRTDVYSLGVVLYELLAGALPFDPEELRIAGLEGILRTLREKDPPRPSTKISTLGRRTTEIAKRRRTEPHRLARQLKGDLDWIVMRALEKDRNRRYGSPRELGQDVRRHLSDLPVVAGPPGAVYRSGKFVRRHRVAVGVTAGALLALIFGVILISVQKAETAAARDEAELVTSTLEEMLASVDPTSSGPDVTVREMLDQTAKTLGEKFAGQPLVEARLQRTVGTTYQALGEYPAAEEHLRRAVGIRSRTLGSDHIQTLAIKAQLGSVIGNQGRHEEAERLLRETLETQRNALGREHPATIITADFLAAEYSDQHRYEEAEALRGEIVEVSRRVFGEEDPRTLQYVVNLAYSSLTQGRYAEAEALMSMCLDTQRRVLGEEHVATLGSMFVLAELYIRQGRFNEADSLLRRTLEISRRVRGDSHPATNNIRYNFACMRALQGRTDEANAFLRAALGTGYRGPKNWYKDGRLSMHDDSDLASLHGDPEFEAIVEEFRRRNEAADSASASTSQ